MILGNSLHALFRRFGWQLQRLRALPEHRRLEEHARSVERWRFLASYPVKSILDVGANEGQFAALAREILPEVEIHSFEPLQEPLQRLHERSPALSPHRIFPFALGREASSQTMFRNESSPSSSFLEMQVLHREELPHTKGVEEERVVVRRLDDIVTEQELAGPFFLKIDVQGFELEVLLGGNDTLQNTLAIVLEVSVRDLYEGAPTFDELYRHLQSQGFVYRGNIDQWRSQDTGLVLQCDCLFERSIPAELAHSPIA